MLPAYDYASESNKTQDKEHVGSNLGGTRRIVECAREVTTTQHC